MNSTDITFTTDEAAAIIADEHGFDFDLVSGNIDGLVAANLSLLSQDTPGLTDSDIAILGDLFVSALA